MMPRALLSMTLPTILRTTLRMTLLTALLLVSGLAQELPSPAPLPPSAAPRSSGSAAPARPPVRRNASPGGSATAPTFKVNVKLVNVFASVVDNEGAPYAKLQKEDFRIFEDGVEQKLAVFERESALPLSIVMALDTSMSTRKDLPLEIASARKFAHAILRPVDAISLYEFSTYVSQALPFTNDERSVDAALSHPRTGPATALYDAIFLGSRALERRQGRKVIVLITDGGDTASKTDYPEAVRAAEIAEAIIYSIIMVPIEADAGRDLGGEHALIQLSRDTGGKYYYATTLAGLDEAFRQIGDELRTQYLLAYYPLSRVGPEFRRIDVELTAAAKQSAQRELSVRHRAGYYNSKIQ
jgi:Ca-activated chloride channel family protein